MSRTQYSLNSYVGGADPAYLGANISNSQNVILISGTNSTWSSLGSNAGFFLALNYGTNTEEKIWVPSGTYSWSSGSVTLSGVTRGVDGTGGEYLDQGYVVVPVLTGIDLQEANQLVAQILSSGNLITTSGYAVLSTGSGITFGNLPATIASFSGPGLSSAPGTITQSGGWTVQDTTASGVIFNTKGKFNVASSGNVSIVSSGNILFSGSSITFYPNTGVPITSVTSSGGTVTNPGNTVTINNPTGPTVNINVTRNDQKHLTDYGIFGDFSTDNGANTNTVLSGLQSSNGGSSVILPPGTIKSSTTFIVPTNTKLEGNGWFYYGTLLSLDASANCDVVQMLKSPNGVVANAFFCTLRDFMIDGNSSGQSVSDWHSGLNCTTNPWSSTASNDPNFDPQHRFERLWIQAATGEGMFFYSRGEMSIDNVWSYNNGGTGFTLPYDTALMGCKSQGNGLGGYLFPSPADTHLSACHSYNNGSTSQFNSITVTGTGTLWTVSEQAAIGNGTFTITVASGTSSAIAWNASASTVAAAVQAITGVGTVTGTSGTLGNPGYAGLVFANSQPSVHVTQTQTWSAGKNVVYSGAIYRANSTLTNYTGNNPYADTTNWNAPARPLYVANSISARGAVNACPEWGYGYYIQGYGAPTTIGITSSSALQNAAGAVYLYQANENVIDLNESGGGCNVANGTLNPTNPHNYAALTLDASNNNIINMAVSSHNSSYYCLRIINGSTGNDIHITTDGTASFLSPDSVTTGNTIWLNGVLQYSSSNNVTPSTYYVTAFGAKGDGSTDDTAAIQACINAAATGGTNGAANEIVFPYGAAGTYLISSHIVFPGGMTFKGLGNPMVESYESFPFIKTKAGSNIGGGSVDAMFVPQYWNNNYTSCDQPVTFYNLGFDGNKSSNTGIADCIILMNYQSTIEKCFFNNSPGHGVHLLDYNKAGTGIGGAAPNNSIVGCYFQNMTGDGVHNDTSGGFNCNTDGFLTDCWFNTMYNGFYNQMAGGWSITGNHFYGISGDAIVINSAGRTRVINNYIENFGAAQVSGGSYHGIYAPYMNNGASVVITNNVINILSYGPTSSGVTGYYFIDVFNNSSQTTTNAIIADNIIVDLSSSGKGVGITVTSSSLGYITLGLDNNLVNTTTKYNVTNCLGATTVFNTDTSISATSSTPTFTNNVAAQLNTNSDSMLYVNVKTSATLGLYIGAVSGTWTPIISPETAALGTTSVRVPKSWYVLVSGTIVDLGFSAVTC